MNKHKVKWLYYGALAAAILQTSVLFYSIEKRASILRSGHEIVLQTEPVDPRDLMRGDYVILGYAIARIERKDITGEPSSNARTVYVALKPDTDGIWQFSRAGFEPFKNLPLDEVQMRGESTYSISDMIDRNAIIHINFGIERYYVPEGEGRAIENSQRDQAITAVVSVDPAGTPAIKAIRNHGQQLFEEPLY